MIVKLLRRLTWFTLIDARCHIAHSRVILSLKSKKTIKLWVFRDQCTGGTATLEIFTAWSALSIDCQESIVAATFPRIIRSGRIKAAFLITSALSWVRMHIIVHILITGVTWIIFAAIIAVLTTRSTGFVISHVETCLASLTVTCFLVAKRASISLTLFALTVLKTISNGALSACVFV